MNSDISSRNPRSFTPGSPSGQIKTAVVLALLIISASSFFFIDTKRIDAEDCDCTFCHGTSNPHGAGWQGCATCHGFPPATGSHAAHFQDSAGIVGNYQQYGSTALAQDYYPDQATPAPAYMMGCGNCHPLDNARHQDGIVDVELYNAAAPADSLKARSTTALYTAGQQTFSDPNNLPYTLGTCSNVYCHSYNDWTTTGSIPDQGWSASIPANVVTTRYYQSPTWGGSSLTCAGCHGNPPQTTFYTNDGGAGDSHSWLDDSDTAWYGVGYDNLHSGWNHGLTPLSCRTCHYDTIKDTATAWRGDIQFWNDPAYWWIDVAMFADAPIYNFAKHVNGTNDVAFDKDHVVSYNHTYSLASATYDASAKTCSNVACHYNTDTSEGRRPRYQQTVPWGAPYRWWYMECDRCHHYW